MVRDFTGSTRTASRTFTRHGRDCSGLALLFPPTPGRERPNLRTYGSFRRNSLPGPGLVNLDFSISKATAITERLKLEIRGYLFNILNHAEFANPDTNSNDIGQGEHSARSPTRRAGDAAPRIIQLAARFSF